MCTHTHRSLQCCFLCLHMNAHSIRLIPNEMCLSCPTAVATRVCKICNYYTVVNLFKYRIFYKCPIFEITI